ncbi:MAG: enoyl-CoA hydratase/isomerase family protein [Antricoccus sp.]
MGEQTSSGASGHDEPLVIRHDQDRWTLLSINRPAKLNALTVGVFTELRRHIEDLAADDDIACVVLRGAGKCFSAGHDLADIATGEAVPSKGWHSETLRMLELLPKPVIAAVHGHCYTGALEVALAADFILAADTARFGDTHAKWALSPVWGMSQRLPRRVGVATAKRLMFTADMIDAAEAVRIGLAEYAVPIDAFDGEITAIAERIVANSAFSHAANKRLLEATDGQSIDAGLQWEIHKGEGRGPDAGDRIAAFTAKSDRRA